MRELKVKQRKLDKRERCRKDCFMIFTLYKAQDSLKIEGYRVRVNWHLTLRLTSFMIK